MDDAQRESLSSQAGADVHRPAAHPPTVPTAVPLAASAGAITFGARMRRLQRAIRVHPVRAMFGPVFQKEVRVAGRRRSTYWIRSVYVLALLALVCLAYFIMQDKASGSQGAHRLQRLQQLAPMLAVFIAWTQFVLLMFVSPLFTAPALCGERTGRTLPALLTTPLSSAQIVLGKLTSSLVMAFLLVMASIPLLLAVRMYGGLNSNFIVQATAVTLSATVLGASFGVLASSLSKRPTSASVMGVVLIAGQCIALPLLIVLVATRLNLRRFPEELMCVSPGVMLASITAEGVEGRSFFARNPWAYACGTYLGEAAVVSLIAALLFRRTMLSEGASSPAAGKRKVAKRRTASTAVPDGADTGSPAKAASIEDGDESLVVRRSREVSDAPVLWREVRQSVFGSRVKLIISLVAAGLLLASLYGLFGASERELHMMIQILGMVVLLIVASVATTSSISSEREQRTWGVLLTTPISPAGIIFGKFLGGVRKCWPVPAVLLFDLLIAVAAAGFHPVVFLHVTLVMVGAIVFLCGTGVLLSLFCRRSITASVLNLAMGVLLWMGIPMIAGIFAELTSSSSGAEQFAEVVLSINPVFLCGTALDGARDSGVDMYHTVNGSTTLAEFTGRMVLVTGLAALASLGAAGIAAILFRNIGGRTS